MLSKKRSRKEYDRNNELRKNQRAEKKRVKEEVPRDGAREEIISNMVTGILKRLLLRKRNQNKASKKRKENPATHNMRRREMKARREKEALDAGIGLDEHMKQRASSWKSKPLFNQVENQKNREQKDDGFRIQRRLSTRLREFLKLSNGTKADGTMALVACTQLELLEHLKSTIPEGENLRDYSIDHIFPCTMYDMKHEEQQRMCMNWSNLRMMKLCGSDGNIAKKNRLPTRDEASGVHRWCWPIGVTEASFVDHTNGDPAH